MELILISLSFRLDEKLQQKLEQERIKWEREMPHYYVKKRKICLVTFHEHVETVVAITDEQECKEKLQGNIL